MYTHIALPDFCTILNACCGSISMFFAISQRTMLAVLFIVLAAVCDFFDGFLARRVHRKGDFGKHLDSLADTVSFVVAPVILGIVTLPFSFLAFFSFLLFISAGILRLARFTVTPSSPFFIGLPTTLAALLVSALFVFSQNVILFSFAYILLALLMVSTVRIKKVSVS